MIISNFKSLSYKWCMMGARSMKLVCEKPRATTWDEQERETRKTNKKDETDVTDPSVWNIRETSNYTVSTYK